MRLDSRHAPPFWWLFLLFCTGCGEEFAPKDQSPLRINEAAPSNHAYQDMRGDTDDWFELYNLGSEELSLSGYCLSDDDDSCFRDVVEGDFRVPAHGVLLVFADGEPAQSSEATQQLHVSFQLSSGGDGIWLRDRDGYVVDAVEWSELPRPLLLGQRASFARFPDGDGAFGWCSRWTPEANNGERCAGDMW